MSVRSRVAFASGAAGTVGAALLLSGRYEGSIVLAFLLAISIRTAALGSLVGAGPILAGGAVRALRSRAWLAPAWAIVIAAVVARTGSTSLSDVRGGNAVIGPALFNGPALTVAGTWFAFAAAALVLLAWTPVGTETAAGRASAGRVVPPAAVARLDAAGVVAEAALIVSLFLGPQVVDGLDAAWWAGGIVALIAVAWYGRRVRLLMPFSLPAVAGAMATAGLVLVSIGGQAVSVPLLFLLLAPLAGAVVAITFGVAPAQRRVLVAICCTAMVGGAASALVRTAAADAVAWRGFSTDVWTSLLALVAVASIVAGIARAGGLRRPGSIEAALFVATAAGVAPLLVGRVHLLAVTLPVSTIAFVCAAFVASGGEPRGIYVRRAAATLALSDVLVLLGIGTAVESGTQLPPELSVTAGALVLAGAGIRLGLFPLWWGADDAMTGSVPVGTIWRGPIRAQGFLLLAFAISAGTGVGYAAAAAAAATVLLGAARGLRGDAGSVSRIGTGLAVLGIALGGPVGLWGAVLSIAALATFAPARLAGSVPRELIRPSASAVPAGAMLPGAVLIVTSAFDVAAVRPAFFAFAIPALAGAFALTAMVLAGMQGRHDTLRARGDRAASALWGWLALGAAVAIAAVPQRVTHGLAFPVADSLGVGRLLRVGTEAGFADDLAVIMIGVAVIAFLAGPGKMGSGGPPGGERRRGTDVPIPIPRPIATLARHERAWLVGGTVLLAASIGVAIRVYVEAAGRGFL